MGLHDLIDHRAKPRAPLLFRADEAFLCQYAHIDPMRLYELVLAYSGVASPGIDGFRHWARVCQRQKNFQGFPHERFEKGWPPRLRAPRELTADDRLYLNLIQARKAVASGELKKASIHPEPEDEEFVKVDDFEAWASRVELPVVAGPWTERRELEGRAGGVVYRFPHPTPCLDALQDIAWRVDEVSKDGWPTEAGFVAIARALYRKLSMNLASAFATILRPKKARRGRPPKPRK